MLLSRQFFPAFLIGLLLFAGVAQAQNSSSGTNPQNSEMKADGGNYLQPWQPCLNADQGQGGVKGSLQEETRQSPKTVNVPLMNPKPNFQNKTQTPKAVGAENSGPKSDLLKPSFKNKGGSTTQNMGQPVSTAGSLPTIPSTAQSSGLGASFLDGYLLKSLHNKEIGRKKGNTEQESKGGLSRKKGITGPELSDDLLRKRVKRTN